MFHRARSFTIVTFASATTLLAPILAHASMTIEEYSRVEAGEVEGVNPDVNLAYVWGVMDALGAFNAAAATYGGELFCPDLPDYEPMGVQDFKENLDERIEAERSRPGFSRFAREATVGDLGLGVLIEAFPCESVDEDSDT